MQMLYSGAFGDERGEFIFENMGKWGYGVISGVVSDEYVKGGQGQGYGWLHFQLRFQDILCLTFIQCLC